MIDHWSEVEHGGYSLLLLAKGNKLHEFSRNEFPIDDYVIDRVEEMSISDNQPIMNNGCTLFE